MALNITQKIRRDFERASLRREAKSILTGRQWELHASLVKRCKAAREKAIRHFDKSKSTRVEVAYRRLLNKAGSLHKKFDHPYARNDIFHKSDLMRQANREVKAIHLSRLARIDNFEHQERSKLMSRSHRQNQLQGKPTRDFTKTVDRRVGQDRRKCTVSPIKHTRRRDR
ncbi:hypothetical protein [Maritalea sp.]|uniref:hypothetical protein n=1 Tax=Maritalea sp. TaxID=2003361 RepID=UPI003EF1CF52